MIMISNNGKSKLTRKKLNCNILTVREPCSKLLHDVRKAKETYFLSLNMHNYK